MFDVEKIRLDFPILQQEVHPGVPVVFLDSAASSQKPAVVIDAMTDYYRTYHANVHRGIYRFSEMATDAFERARVKVADFINAAPQETIFTRNTTEALNLVAYSWGRANLRAGDELLCTEMEHHANLVPWQLLAEQTGATLRYLPILADGTLDLSRLDEFLTERTRLFAFTAVSNVLGTINPVKRLVQAAQQVGAVTVVDAAQAAPHMAIDVRDLDCDFLAFSAHKMCGPTGIGVLYGKLALLQAMPPFLAGGEMISRVSYGGAEWNDLPHKFEAGTQAIAEAIGFGVAIDYLNELGMDQIAAHEHQITSYAWEALQDVEGLHIIGPAAAGRGGLIAFTLADVHPHDLSSLLDEDGIAVRAGNHCAMPLHHRLGIRASTRASFYIHTTTAEIDHLVQSLNTARALFTL